MENAGTMDQILVYVTPKIPHVPLPPFTNVPLFGKIPVFVYDWNRRYVAEFFSWKKN